MSTTLSSSNAMGILLNPCECRVAVLNDLLAAHPPHLRPATGGTASGGEAAKDAILRCPANSARIRAG
jgi:hypothetical protein